MDVNTSRADLLPEMLRAILDPEHHRPDEAPSGSIWRLRAAVPERPARQGGGALAREDRARPHRAASRCAAYDWSRTRAFAHPAENQGYIRLNLRGRERDGIVDPADAPALMDEIAAGIALLHRARRSSGGRDPSTAWPTSSARRPRPPAARPDRALDGHPGHPASKGCGPSATARSAATASAAAARATTPRATRGRSSCRARRRCFARSATRASRTSPPPPLALAGGDPTVTAGEPLLVARSLSRSCTTPGRTVASCAAATSAPTAGPCRTPRARSRP